MNQPEKYHANPVLQPEHPWESGVVHHQGTVLYDDQEGIFKFWYHARPDFKERPWHIDGVRFGGYRSFLCYATSRDGVTWQRPKLGQVDFEGSTDNNIIRIGNLNPAGVAVLHDLDERDTNRRYKALWWEHGRVETRTDGLALGSDGPDDGIWVAFSPDGIHWNNYHRNPVLSVYSDTGHYVIYDRAAGRYITYGRFGFDRTLARTESTDFLHWTNPRLVLEPDGLELTGRPPATQFYGMTVDTYEGMHLGGLWVYKPGTGGTIDTQLTTSYDGVHWQRVADRQTFMPLGPSDGWDNGMVRPAGHFIVRDRDICIFYGMVNGPHAGMDIPEGRIVRHYPCALGLARILHEMWLD